MQQYNGLPETLVVSHLPHLICKSLKAREKYADARAGHILGGILQTKLTRRSAGAVHLWLGYAGQISGPGQPTQPATVTPAATRPLGSRRQPAVASTSQRWPAVIRPLTSMSGPRVRQDKSMPALPRPDSICQATVPAAATSFFCLRDEIKNSVGRLT